MALDRVKLREMVTALRSGASGAAAVYGDFLDRLPTKFGSTKLAGEADLILAALAAAELAHADAVSAIAPIAIEPAGVNADGRTLFRPTKFALIGGLPSDWAGVPLYALACALGRARERSSIDDEIYTASFVYVLFRLKAALGVWRGDTSPDARYRLWLKDLAPAIAAHPRLGPKVTSCHEQIAERVIDACEAYRQALGAGQRLEPPLLFTAFAPTVLFHVQKSRLEVAKAKEVLASVFSAASIDAFNRGANGWMITLCSAELRARTEQSATVEQSNELASAYMNRGTAKQDAAGHGPGAAILDYDEAIALRKSLRATLEPLGDWDPSLRNLLARAHMNRGSAKQAAASHGPGAAILDYDEAIALMKALRATLEPLGAWDPPLRNDLAAAHMCRGNDKQRAAGHGPGAAILDYDESIALRTALRATLEPLGAWDPTLRNDLANAYVNRGNAKQYAAGHGPGAAILDYDEAIALMKSLRATLEPLGAWDPPLRNDLANAYVARGNARQNAAGHLLGAGIQDYDEAIALMKALRATLEPLGDWNPPLRNDLARAYMNRGNAKQDAAGHGPGAAMLDYDEAIAFMKSLRATLEPLGAWDPSLRNLLARAYMNRGSAKQNAAGHLPGAGIQDYDEAIALMKALRATLEPRGAWDPPLRNDLALAYANLAEAKEARGDRVDACRDATLACDISAALIEEAGSAALPFWHEVVAFAAELVSRCCTADI